MKDIYLKLRKGYNDVDIDNVTYITASNGITPNNVANLVIPIEPHIKLHIKILVTNTRKRIKVFQKVFRARINNVVTQHDNLEDAQKALESIQEIYYNQLIST